MAGFSIAQAAIAINAVLLAAAFLFRWLGEPADARVAAGIFSVLNFLPATAALVLVALPTFFGAPLRTLLPAWPPLAFVLSIPFWIWTDRRWRRRLERRISAEVERRIEASRDGGVEPGQPDADT